MMQIVVALSVLIAANVQTPAPLALHDLIVPRERLPADCVPAESPYERLADGKVRRSFWMGMPIRTNPWTGTDAVVISLIREQMDGPFPVPDGPPLSRGELSAFRLRLADGIEEGYVAFYQQEESRPEVLRVFGVRVAEGRELNRSLREARRREDSARSVRIRSGLIHAVLHGDGGPCFQAIAAHLTTLAR